MAGYVLFPQRKVARGDFLGARTRLGGASQRRPNGAQSRRRSPALHGFGRLAALDVLLAHQCGGPGGQPNVVFLWQSADGD